MTVPPPGSATRQRRDEEALHFEEQTATAATAALTALLASLTQQLTVAYIRAAGGVQQPLPDDQRTTYRAAVVAALTALAGRAGVDAIRQAARRLHAALPAGIQLGADHAQEVAGPVDTPLTVPRELTAAVDDMVANARTDLAVAVKLARVGRLDRYTDLTVVTAQVRRAATRVERTARWASTAAVSSGVAQVTDAADVSRIWIAERSACLTCLAYSGHVVGPGQMFPAGLTFGKASTVVEPIAGPPAHPSCRCRAEAWVGSKAGFVDLPEVLKREAQRTVLAGTSAYASNPARIGAADRLLRVGTKLPKTVRARAGIAVRRGSFTPNR